MIRSLILGLATAFALSASASADLFQFSVNLNGAQEVPANGSPGTGTATAIFDNVSGQMTINGIFSGLTAPATAAHLHGFAPAGVNAGVLIGLSVTAGTSGTVSGSGTIANTGSNFANVLGGLTYINIHNATFPGGEIRGQLVNPIPEPGSLAVLSLAGLALLAQRRR